MHLFERTPLIYLSLHLLAFALTFMSVMGIPGNPAMTDENKAFTEKLFKIWNVFLIIAWKGFPGMFAAALLAFFFHYDSIGKIICCISLAIGLGLFSTVVLYYSRSSK